MNARRNLSLVAVLACAAVAGACVDQPTDEQPTLATPVAAPAAARSQGFVPGRVIARLRPGVGRSTLTRHRPLRVGAELLLPRTLVLEVEPGTELEVAAELAATPGVEFAEPDYLLTVLPCEVGQCLESNDSFRGRRWDLHNDGSVNDTNGALLGITEKTDSDIDWQEMYDHLGPNFSGSAVIAIIDTGVRKTHNDLLGKVIAERNFATTDPAQVNNADDDNSHGTHVAGIAAGRTNNVSGSMGVAYGTNIKVLAIKSCNAAGSCPTSASANGIVWATDNGANVINLSLSGFGSAVAGSSLQLAALQYAASKNVLPVCSTGNDAHKTNPALWNPVYTGGIGYPARFNECFAVGATTWGDGWASYSNHGPGIDIAAPGGDANPLGTAWSYIFSPSNSGNGNYVYKSGTSMAAPQVAGLAAVLFASGMTSAAEVRARIIATADDMGPAGWDQKFGFGRINAYRAVTGLDPDARPVARPGSGYAGSEGSPVDFDGSASADPNGKGVTFQWTFGDGGSATVATPSHAYADNGTFGVVLTVTDPAGFTGSATASAAIANVAPAVTLSLSGGSVASGGTVSASGGFSDPGVLDAPWGYAFAWGDAASSTGSTALQGEVSGSHRFCGAGTRTVVLSVTDKDGGTGSASAQVSVQALAVALQAASSTNGQGKFPVKVLSTASFDATELNPSTITLAGASVARRNNGTLMASHEDANGDGRMDLVLHFERTELPEAGTMSFTGTHEDGCRVVAGSHTVG